jgi:hypothetical protein
VTIRLCAGERDVLVQEVFFFVLSTASIRLFNLPQGTWSTSWSRNMKALLRGTATDRAQLDATGCWGGYVAAWEVTKIDAIIQSRKVIFFFDKQSTIHWLASYRCFRQRLRRVLGLDASIDWLLCWHTGRSSYFQKFLPTSGSRSWGCLVLGAAGHLLSSSSSVKALTPGDSANHSTLIHQGDGGFARNLAGLFSYLLHSILPRTISLIDFYLLEWR